MGGMVFVFLLLLTKHTSSNIKNTNGVKGYYVLQTLESLHLFGDDGNVASFAFTICWGAAAALGYCIVAFALLCCTLQLLR